MDEQARAGSWDRRHEEARDAPPRAPDAFVLEALELVGPASGRRALDLACGRGRHALELARRGWRVEGLDASGTALEVLSERAAREGLEIATRRVELPEPRDERGAPADLVLVVDFLDRELLAHLHERVAPGGHALVATFTVDRPGQHPRRAWCLERGELSRGLPGLVTRLHREADGRAGLLARRPADAAPRHES